MIYSKIKLVKKYISKLKSLLENYFLEKRYKKLKAAFEIESHMTIKERVKLYQLSLNKKTIVEIGSYLGASSYCFALAISKNNISDARVICVDSWQNDAMSEGNRDTFLSFKKNVAPFSENIIPVRGMSFDVIESVRSISSYVDVLFIDGDHSYEGVKADWENYKSLLGAGSIVIMHDSGWADGVKRVIQEDIMPFTNNYHALPNMWWCELSENS